MTSPATPHDPATGPAAPADARAADVSAAGADANSAAAGTPDPSAADADAASAADVTAADPSPDDVLGSAPAPAPAPAVEVADVVDPALVRRAPRFKAFALAGIVVGLVAGLLLNVLVLPDDHPTWSRTIFTVEVTLVALAVAIVWALVADRRSARAPRA